MDCLRYMCQVANYCTTMHTLELFEGLSELILGSSTVYPFWDSYLFEAGYWSIYGSVALVVSSSESLNFLAIYRCDPHVYPYTSRNTGTKMADLTNFHLTKWMFIDLMVLVNFSQICHSKISLMKLMILTNFSQVHQSQISLAYLKILTNFHHFSLPHAFLDI